MSDGRPGERASALHLHFDAGEMGEEAFGWMVEARSLRVALNARLAALPNLRLRGLMAIPEPETDHERQRAAFARLRALYEQVRAEGIALDTLSMGMSGDLAAAVAEGATIVRIGSAIFGSRTYAD